MEIENENNLEIENTTEVETEEQKSFLETTIGKVVNSALDIGIKMVVPDLLEDSVIDIKDSLLENGLKEGITTAIDNAVDLGKSVLGIFTGNFEDVSQAEKAVKSGGIIDGISDAIDSVLDITESKGVLSSTITDLISSGKDIILDNISDKIEDTFINQSDKLENLNDSIESWKEAFDKQDFEIMEEEYAEITEILEDLIPINSVLEEVSTIENLHNLIKNNGQNFDLTTEEEELATMLT